MSLTQKFNTDKSKSFAVKHWREIETQYSKRNRHYHTLHHLENILLQLTEVKAGIGNWDVVLFALFYHDIVYNVLKKDNEEKSAALAAKRLGEQDVPGYILDECCAMILATKNHVPSDNNDINLFTDADLSILGAEWNVYENYCKQIRDEYKVYPDFLYKPGRKKVLQHFLSMKQIFKTAFFFEKFEENAKYNLSRELELLN